VTASAGGNSGVNFADSGGYLFTTENGIGDPIHRTPLGTDYDLSSASSTQTTNQSDDNAPAGVAFNPAGTKMIMLGRANSSTGDNTLYEYDLSTAFLPSSRTLNTSESIETFTNFPADLKVVDSGNKAFWADASKKEITGIAFSSYTVPTPPFQAYYLDVSSQASLPYSLDFNSDGTILLVGDRNNYLYQYDLTTGFDLNSAVFNTSILVFNTSILVTDMVPTFDMVYGIALSDDDTTMILLDNSDTYYSFSR